jgi:glycosyltransferase involved in cell wall biosynthesis
MMNKKTVILRGPSLSQSGYGVHCRQVARWLLNKPNIDVRFHVLPWGDTPWFVNPDAQDGLIGQIMQRTVDGNYRADISFQLQLPNEWDPKIAKYNIGMTAGVETDKCNIAWIHAINSMNRVIVPSKHVADCFKNTGAINVPMDVIPESYIDALELPDEKLPKLPRFSTDFNFLIFGQVTGNNPHNDRKNTFFTLKWLCEAFKNDKNVGIVIKTNAGRNTKFDRNIVQQMLNSALKECRKEVYPRIHLLHGEMNDEEVAAIYRHPQIKALVAATRGEGYGLPILEAAASGLPVIATGWSGHTDFLNRGKYISLQYNLSEVHASRIDNKIFVKGTKWANVIEEDFKRKVIKFKEGSSIPKEWAQDLSSKIKPYYGFKNICCLYDELLQDVV